MQQIIGWIALFLGGALLLVQLISAVNFRLAQKLGLQEDPEFSDPILQRSEQYTAYWDLVVLGWFPLAGFFMIINHNWWQVFSLIAASIYFDAAGREALKILCFKHEGIRIGRENQSKIFFSTYFMMVFMAVVMLAYSLNSIIR